MPKGEGAGKPAPVTLREAYFDAGAESAKAWSQAMRRLRSNHIMEFVELLNAERRRRGLLELHMLPPGGRRLYRRMRAEEEEGT